MAALFLLSDIFAGGITVDPSIGPGVSAPIGALLPRKTTAQLWQKTGALDTDWTLISLSDGDKGDITVSGAGSVWTIDAGVVTFAKMQNIATDSLIGRDTAGVGSPESITLNATLEFTGAQAIQRAALTGDVTAGAGSNATTIANSAVTNAKMANMADSTIKGRAAGAGAGAPQDLTGAQVQAIVNAGSIMTWGNNDVAAAADTRFLQPGRQQGTAPATDIAQMPMTRAGTLKNFFVRHNASVGDGDNVVYTVQVNGVDTTITVTLASNAVAQASDVTHTQAVAQGDRVGIKAVKAASITNGNLDVQATLELV